MCWWHWFLSTSDVSAWEGLTSALHDALYTCVVSLIHFVVHYNIHTFVRLLTQSDANMKRRDHSWLDVGNVTSREEMCMVWGDDWLQAVFVIRDLLLTCRLKQKTGQEQDMTLIPWHARTLLLYCCSSVGSQGQSCLVVLYTKELHRKWESQLHCIV